VSGLPSKGWRVSSRLLATAATNYRTVLLLPVPPIPDFSLRPLPSLAPSYVVSTRDGTTLLVLTKARAFAPMHPSGLGPGRTAGLSALCSEVRYDRPTCMWKRPGVHPLHCRSDPDNDFQSQKSAGLTFGGLGSTLQL
jgi:hypothetical protein